MSQQRFPVIPRFFAGRPSRRDVLRGLSGACLGLVALHPLGAVLAKKNRQRKDKKPKLKRNLYGCVDVGGKCYGNDGNCCSGICQGEKPEKGRKDRSRCMAHDASTCLAGQTDGFCSGVMGEVGCVTSTDEFGVCLTTTGNGPYCAIFAECFPCETDADCAPFCGPAAACIACPANCAGSGGTLCAKPSSGACALP